MTATAWDGFSSADEYVGAQVNQLMFLRKMTRKDLGMLLGGIDGQTAGRKLRGERSWSLDELLVISRHFEVPLTDLMPGNDYAPVLEGRGRVVRHQGLEPRTRCFEPSVVRRPTLRLFPGPIITTDDDDAELAEVVSLVSWRRAVSA